mmetsp:Transcript_28745/g.66756  ORF Transcript_28745/g.66756 Transcript_28745/m.66756 type:complete len:107 (+) Transcript_28745:112-432(+)
MRRSSATAFQNASLEALASSPVHHAKPPGCEELLGAVCPACDGRDDHATPAAAAGCNAGDNGAGGKPARALERPPLCLTSKLEAPVRGELLRSLMRSRLAIAACAL